MPVSRTYYTGTGNSSAAPSSTAIPVTLHNEIVAYHVQLEIGSNPSQPITLQIDTGSSDIWAYGRGSCAICEGGIYNPSRAADPGIGAFSIQYFDNTQVFGRYVQDSITIGGTTVQSAILAVASTSADRGTGVMGIGFDRLESTRNTYNGFIDDLVNQKLIAKHAYSVYLDDLQSSTGALILGGYNTSKYKGSLAILPIVAAEDGEARLAIEWDGISVTDASGRTTYTSITQPFPRSATLDTGYTTTVLPNDIFDKLARRFGATLLGNNYVVHCNLGSGSVEFTFGGGAKTISVPFSELALPRNGLCLFGFQPAGNNRILSLGDTFLRSAYVVYDFDDMVIGIAQARYGSTCSNCIVPI